MALEKKLKNLSKARLVAFITKYGGEMPDKVSAQATLDVIRPIEHK
jgi:hypothetical protein